MSTRTQYYERRLRDAKTTAFDSFSRRAKLPKKPTFKERFATLLDPKKSTLARAELVHLLECSHSFCRDDIFACFYHPNTGQLIGAEFHDEEKRATEGLQTKLGEIEQHYKDQLYLGLKVDPLALLNEAAAKFNVAVGEAAATFRAAINHRTAINRSGAANLRKQNS